MGSQPSTRTFLRMMIVIMFMATPHFLLAATIEFLDGKRLECKVLSKDDKSVTIEITADGKTTKQTIPLAKVHQVTINDKKYLINERPAEDSKAKNGEEPAAKGKKSTRTKAEVEALINEMGRKPPDWFEETPLIYPKSLDLSWPDGPLPDGWNNQKNVGQYVWDIINHNPGKWKEGVRLMHHLLTLHQSDAEKRVKIMNELGRMYHNLHQDHARAAFWWRQSGVDKSHSPPGISVHLAECYWKLGNKQMAVEYLRKMNPVPYDAIKLWADMGETKQALQIAETAARNGSQPYFAYLYAADACRVAGRHKEAIDFYQKVLAIPTEAKKGQIDRCHQRAQSSIEAIKLFDQSDVKKVADGTFKASSIGYEGPVEVEVIVRSNQIDSVRVTQHKEKQFYSAMTDTPAKILSKQSVKGIDATSSATITSEAIINATAKALASGAK